MDLCTIIANFLLLDGKAVCRKVQNLPAAKNWVANHKSLSTRQKPGCIQVRTCETYKKKWQQEIRMKTHKCDAIKWNSCHWMFLNQDATFQRETLRYFCSVLWDLKDYNKVHEDNKKLIENWPKNYWLCKKLNTFNPVFNSIRCCLNCMHYWLGLSND